MKKGLEFTRKDREGIVILAIAGNLAMDSYQELKTTFNGLQDSDFPNVILNLSKITAAGSSAVGALVALLREVKDRGGRLALAEPSPIFIQVLELLNLRDFFEIFSSEEEAVAEIKAAD